MKLTEWFGPEVKPTMPGVYQTNAVSLVPAYQKWDGKRWGAYACSIDSADQDGHTASCCQKVDWRGLAEKP